MSWSEVFPIMDDSMVDDFEIGASPEEKSELEQWFGISQKFNEQPDKRHVVAFSLFWKPAAISRPPYPVPTRDILKNASSLGLDLRFDPWPHYFQPAFDETPKIREKYPDVVVRVYLAADLDFLVDDFVNVGCEVCLMRHPSLAHAPGVAWRVLAFSEKDRLVTMVDVDRMKDVYADIERTESMERDGMGAWRVVVPIDFEPTGGVCYRPLMGCQVGAKGGWPMEKLLAAFTWHSLKGNIPGMVDLPSCGPRPISWSVWPNWGFEEWFLAVVMYPRFAATGILTFVETFARSMMLALDVEYATWSHPRSQLIFFPSGACCAYDAPDAPTGDAQETNALEQAV